MYLLSSASVEWAERKVNYTLSTARICVEWGFGATDQLWRGLTIAQNLKLQEGVPVQSITVAVFLSNLYTCMYGKDCSSTAAAFDLDPPSLDEYRRQCGI